MMVGLVLTAVGVWGFILAFHWYVAGSPSANPGAWRHFEDVALFGVTVALLAVLMLLCLSGGLAAGVGSGGG